MGELKKIYTLPVLFLLALVLYGCGSTPKIDVWALEEGVFQYFVSPSELKGDNNKKRVLMDFTAHQYRKNPEKNKVVCNFTVLKKGSLGSDLAAAYFIINGDESQKVELLDIELMYIKSAERKVRFTSTIEEAELKRLVSAEEFLFVTEFSESEQILRFVPTKYFLIQMVGMKDDLYG